MQRSTLKDHPDIVRARLSPDLEGIAYILSTGEQVCRTLRPNMAELPELMNKLSQEDRKRLLRRVSGLFCGQRFNAHFNQ